MASALLSIFSIALTVWMNRVYVGRSEVSRTYAQEELVLCKILKGFTISERKESLTGFQAWNPSIGYIIGFDLEALFRRKRSLKNK